MYLSIIILSLLGSIVSGFFGRKVGVSGAQLITCLSIIITTVLAIIAFLEVGFNNITVSAYLFRWIDSEWFHITWGFQFDSLTVSMLIPVLIISSLVHVYSIGYMNGDPHNQRFFSYLSLFTLMMIILVTANNYLLMFVGWEGVGVCSYLLVSFWFTRIAANQSSMSAFLTNRVGDCFLTIGMFIILWSLGNLDYSTVFSLAPYINENVVTLIGICLLIGAMAKSSQIGLHVWLPMAMEGPTPVSALIHAATMVTAGVYLLMRSSPLIEYSSTILLLCLWLGAITTVFSSLIGLFQQDIKKVIAYSTMSQLGMMVIAVGLSSYNIALFHLINHAFYKGLLFLGAGAVIHAVADNQDFRKYGGLISFLPLSYSVMLIASLSLIAFPFMSGFYSKDLILESSYGQYYFSSIAVYFIAVIGATFTTLYSIKVLYLTFMANPLGGITSYKAAHESDIFISLPLILLAIFSIFFGFITKDIFVGLGSDFFADNSIFIYPDHEIMINTEFAVPSILKLLPFISTIFFSVLAIILSEYLPELIIRFKLSKLGKTIFGFFNQRFLVEYFYNKYITNVILYLGGQTTKILDKGSIELLGPYGLEKGLVNISKNITSLNTSIIPDYALFILIGFISYLFFINFLFIEMNLILLILISLSITISLNVSSNIRRSIKI
jgi:NADH-ubiquinone oxidoreductase chain 5